MFKPYIVLLARLLPMKTDFRILPPHPKEQAEWTKEKPV